VDWVCHHMGSGGSWKRRSLTSLMISEERVAKGKGIIVSVGSRDWECKAAAQQKAAPW